MTIRGILEFDIGKDLLRRQWFAVEEFPDHCPLTSDAGPSGPATLIASRQYLQNLAAWISRTVKVSGAGDGNRTHVRSLGSFYTAIVRRPL
jgi:hypothetical protein